MQRPDLKDKKDCKNPPTSDNGKVDGNTMETGTQLKGKVEINEKKVSALEDESKASDVVKHTKTSSEYFNTLSENEPEPHLIKFHH